MLAQYAPLAATLDREIAWFDHVLEDRMHRTTEGAAAGPAADLAPPDFTGPSPYGAAVDNHRLDGHERLALILALIPWVRPQALDPLLLRNGALDRPFTEFGGIAMARRGFVPTRETALFLIAGDDLALRTRSLAMFSSEAALVRNRLLARQADDYAPWMPLEPHPELIERLFRAPD